MKPIPDWVIFHVPHDATAIPDAVRSHFVLSEAELNAEVLRMTDHLTYALFTRGVSTGQVVRFPVSRLVVDPERFENDALEPLAALGMGVIYQRTSSGNALRHPITESERQALIDTWYRPHHEQLTSTIQRTLHEYGRVLIIDAHSFSAKPMRHEADQRIPRPAICIGTDNFHTPTALSQTLLAAFRLDGFVVQLNAPFSGALVPMSFYRINPLVHSVLIEVNRTLYINEATGQPNENFDEIAERIRRCISLSLAY